MGASVITSGTAVASTSGTAINFTSIPSWVKRITMSLNVVSTNGTSAIQIQLGTGGTPETTGYNAMSVFTSTSINTTRGAIITNGFPITIGGVSTSDNFSGVITICLIGSNTWACMGSVCTTSSGYVVTLSGSKTLAGVLNMVRLIANGTDTFDAGSINILYE
jgi:hypothetical protein